MLWLILMISSCVAICWAILTYIAGPQLFHIKRVALDDDDEKIMIVMEGNGQQLQKIKKQLSHHTGDFSDSSSSSTQYVIVVYRPLTSQAINTLINMKKYYSPDKCFTFDDQSASIFTMDQYRNKSNLNPTIIPAIY
jgi:hypothetical protein